MDATAYTVLLFSSTIVCDHTKTKKTYAKNTQVIVGAWSLPKVYNIVTIWHVIDVELDLFFQPLDDLYHML